MPQKNNRIDISYVISYFNKFGINNLLVEARPTISGTKIETGYFNDLIIYIAPVLLSSEANNLIKLKQIKTMKQRINFSYKDIKSNGSDIRITLESI